MTSTEAQTEIDQTEIEPIETEQTEPQTETGPNAEAAKYRRQLRDTETERDQLRDQLDTAHRQIIEGHAASRLTKPSALWAAGVTIAECQAEDGTISTDLVNDAVERAINELGLASPHKIRLPAPDHSLGKGNGGHRNSGWSDAFRY